MGSVLIPSLKALVNTGYASSHSLVLFAAWVTMMSPSASPPPLPRSPPVPPSPSPPPSLPLSLSVHYHQHHLSQPHHQQYQGTSTTTSWSACLPGSCLCEHPTQGTHVPATGPLTDSNVNPWLISITWTLSTGCVVPCCRSRCSVVSLHLREV